MNKLLILILISCFTSVGLAENLNDTLNSEDKKLVKHCFEVKIEEDKLEKWSIPALQNKFSIGCPPTSPGSPLYNLEILSQQGGECREEALGILVGFYEIFTNHPNYTMCGLVRKQQVTLSRAAMDGKICTDQAPDKVTVCFLYVDKIIVDLKNNGEQKAAFELAKKVANSNDITGLSQMTLGVMYGFGEGTNKNVPLAIKLLKNSLEKINDSEIRVNVLMFLSVFNEELGDYKNAKQYAQQCAVMGDVSCKKGLKRLETMGH